MSPLEYVSVAKVLRTHGLKGEVAVASATAASLSFLEGESVWLVPPPAAARTLTVSAVRQGPRGPLIRFSEIHSIDAASNLVGREILADASIIPAADLPQDDSQVVGFRVVDHARGELGTVTDTIVTGANDVWVVNGPFGEVLIPVIDDVVDEIDFDARRITVRLLDGLLPEESPA